MKLLSGVGLQELLADHDGVVSTSEVLKYMTEDQLRWQISSGRWQKPARGVVVTQSGPLTYRQALRAALLRAGPRAALAGLTAARLDGFKGFDDKRSISQGWSSGRSGCQNPAARPPAVTRRAAGAGQTSRGTTSRSWSRSTAHSTPGTRSSAGTIWSVTSTWASTAT